MMSDDIGSTTITPREIVAILYRRRYWLAIPVIVGLLAAVVAAWLLQPVYRSSATLLITSQQIPTTIIASPLSTYADERIAKIRQQIMSRENLAGLIASRDLYRRERSVLPLDDVVAIMRHAISVELVGSNTGAETARSGTTIAFNLTFDYRDPRIARMITRRLAAMFLVEDKRLRTEQAYGTAAFLGRRADELRDRLVGIASQRRAIEAHYAGALPEQVAMTTQSSAALRAELSRIDAESQGLMQQNSLLAARGEEIAALPRPGTEALRRAEERLNQLGSVYAPNFPDVVAARDTVARQRADLRSAPTAAPGSGVIATEVAAGRVRIGMLAARRAALIQSISTMEGRASLAPQAGYELANLQRDYETIRLQYQGIREKQMDAQVVANLQDEGKGERFSIVNAPSLPVEPNGPRRMHVVAVGTFGGLGLALLALVVWEVMAGPIHGAGAIGRLTGAPPLVIIPVLKTGRGRFWPIVAWWRSRRTNRSGFMQEQAT